MNEKQIRQAAELIAQTWMMEKLRTTKHRRYADRLPVGKNIRMGADGIKIDKV